MNIGELGEAKRQVNRPRRTQRAMTVAAALLLIGGGAAVTVAFLNQDELPTAPTAEARGALRPPSTNSHPDELVSPSDHTRPSEEVRTPGALPATIRIPSIDVTSALTTVGLDANGALEVPQPGPKYDKAAWFRGSPAPGENGPAVIEGHVDGEINGPSVFYRLGELEPSDVVMITRRDGSLLRFEVYAVRLYPKNNFPTLKVYGNTGEPELRLITCGGTFDPNRAEGGYTENVVIFARQV